MKITWLPFLWCFLNSLSGAFRSGMSAEDWLQAIIFAALAAVSHFMPSGPSGGLGSGTAKPAAGEAGTFDSAAKAMKLLSILAVRVALAGCPSATVPTVLSDGKAVVGPLLNAYVTAKTGNPALGAAAQGVNAAVVRDLRGLAK